MSLELKCNGKKYRWVDGKRWGEEPVYRVSISWKTIIVENDNLNGVSHFDTCHTPDQLVAIGYMEEVKEPEWLPKRGEAILVWDADTDQRIIWILCIKDNSHRYKWLLENGITYKNAQKIPEPLQSEIKKLLNS